MDNDSTKRRKRRSFNKDFKAEAVSALGEWVKRATIDAGAARCSR